MRDHALFQRILGIEHPWRVESVQLDDTEEVLTVRLTHRVGHHFACPECGTPCPGYDHQERSWRHLDTDRLSTILTASVPRIQCAAHGVLLVTVPWAERRSIWTAAFERWAIDVIEESGRAGAERLLGLSWSHTNTIMKRAVARGQARRAQKVIPRIGVDEKSSRKGHKYVTTVCDLDTGVVLYVAKTRSAAALAGYYQSLSPQQLAGIEAVAMDMHDAYISATLQHVPNAESKIVFDKFHVVKHINEGVDQIRRAEHKELKAAGDKRLTGTRYHWLKNPNNFDPGRWRDFAPLRKSKLRTARGWAIKELFANFWEYTYAAPATRFFKRWYNWASRSRLGPMKEKARTLKRHLPNILTYLKHGITNAMSEGINSKIQQIKHRARGFRTDDGFITAIYFHCGGLDLYPECPL